MIAGVRGRLISATFAQTLLPTLPGAAVPSPAVSRALAAWSDRREAIIGPASSVRAISDAVIVPLLAILGFDVARRMDRETGFILDAVAPSGVLVPIMVVGWGEPLDRAWRPAVLGSVRVDARWCCCCNGTAFRLLDAHRTWTRQYLEFDLTLLSREPAAFTLLWSLARADTLGARPPLLDRAVELSARHGVRVCKALGRGVLEALDLLLDAFSRGRIRCPRSVLFEDALTVLYRVLFLLFAEARGLVPIWHPVYRDRYSIEVIVATLLARRRYRGVWQAVRAISRLVSSGCSAGELTVTAFNGRLFSSDHATTFDRARIDDELLGRALIALSTFPSNSGDTRHRIAFRDLDVEQLGAVYEHVLEYEPAPGLDVAAWRHREGGRTPQLCRTSDARKSSGTFYTPRAVTAHLVNRTLEPLVRDRRADDILALRVVDPAMGSGAFLVSACRYLAEAAEDALIQEGRWHKREITQADRTGLRREIAQRCLFGVDLNPMAVQLARLSLWLATLASDRPLTFLDHHLVAGDSLVSATPEDAWRQPSKGWRSSQRHEPLPLFDSRDLSAAFEQAVRRRLRLASDPDDSVAAVRAKERTLAELQARDSPLGRWSRVLDLWCAGWFWEEDTPLDRGVFGELCDWLLRGRCALPRRVATLLVERADASATRRHFLHWPLAFPEVWSGEPGACGFDAAVGNPPWDMVRGDSGGGTVRAERKREARQLTDFVRESGIYTVASRAHLNRYRLFVERALQIVRPGGRVGLVLPFGALTDGGAAPLRRHLFERAAVDSVTGFDNRGGIFPIHRSVRFALLTATTAQPTTRISCRFGITRPDDLDRPDQAWPALLLTRRLIARVSGDDDLAVPELTGEVDLRIVENVSARVPGLGAGDGWRVRFGRELNASDDRSAFVPFDRDPAARPVLEGKYLDPFRVSLDRCRYQLRAGSLLRVPRRTRLAYRDVASATNRLTLIAAVIPPRAVTTHTLSCLKTAASADAQHVLCALLNSFVANYFVRLRVSTHVTAALMSRLPVPPVEPSDCAFGRLAFLARLLADGGGPVAQMPEHAELQALAARLYGLTEADFAHILSTFPLVPEKVRREALAAFNNLH